MGRWNLRRSDGEVPSTPHEASQRTCLVTLETRWAISPSPARGRSGAWRVEAKRRRLRATVRSAVQVPHARFQDRETYPSTVTSDRLFPHSCFIQPRSGARAIAHGASRGNGPENDARSPRGGRSDNVHLLSPLRGSLQMGPDSHGSRRGRLRLFRPSGPPERKGGPNSGTA